MNFKHTQLISTLALTGLLSACGGDNNDNNSVLESNKSSQYSGRVTDEKGSPVAGVSVRLESRISDLIAEAITQADGSFSAKVEPGMYDIIFDDKNDVKFTSLQKTAIDLQEDKKDEVRLQSTHLVAENQLTATVRNLDGTPAALRTLIILPSIARSSANIGEAQLPNPFTVQTDAQGKFSASLGQVGMDFDFDTLVVAPGAPELDVSQLAQGYEFASQEEDDAFQQTLQRFLANHVQESVDIEKPNGAMHLDLVIGSSIRNLRDSTGGPSLVPSDEALLNAYEKKIQGTELASLQMAWNALKDGAEKIFLNIIPSAYAGELIRKFSFHVESNGKSRTGIFQNGELKPQTAKRFLSIDEINDGSFKPEELGIPADFGEKTKLLVTNATGFSSVIYSYQVRLERYNRGTYKFTDKTNDTYQLKVYRNAGPIFPINILNYNSKSPEITKFSYTP